MADRTPAEQDWQKTANAVGLGLGFASIGFAASQITRRPELAIAGLAFGAVLTTMLWRHKERS